MSRILIAAAACVLGGCLDQATPDGAYPSPADPSTARDGAPAPGDAGPAAESGPAEDPAPDPRPAPPGAVNHVEATDAAGGHPVDPHEGPVRVAYLIDAVGDSDWLRFELPVATPITIRVLPLDGGLRCDGLPTLALFAADEADPRLVQRAERPGECLSMAPRDSVMMRALPAGVWRVRVADPAWQQVGDAPENIVEVALVEALVEGDPCLADGDLRACGAGLLCAAAADEPRCAAAGCGDGALDVALGEQCDDGNRDDGDGCSADCAIEGGRSAVGTPCAADAECAAGSVCRSGACRAVVCGDGLIDPGEECEAGVGCVGCAADSDAPRNVEPDDADAPWPLAVWAGEAEVGFTLTPAGDVDWFTFDLAAPARVTLQTRSFRGEDSCEGDTVLTLFGPDGAQLAVNDDRLDGAARLCSLIEGQLLGAGRYGVQVGAFGDRTAGLNLLQLGVTAARVAGQRCNNLDPTALCGPGLVCIDSVCTAARCGDGVLSDGEQCDDGNAVDGDGCDACAPTPADIGEPCGVRPCVDGAYCTLSADGVVSVCAPIVCGDGVVSAGEQCDDGNALDGDGCAACAFEVDNVEPDDPDAPFVLDLADGAAEVAFAIAPVGDADWFAFDLEAPAVVEIETRSALDPEDCAGDTVIDLFDLALGLDAPVARDDDGGAHFCSRIAPERYPQVDPLPAGSYLIRVTAFGDRVAGPDVLAVRRVDAPLDDGCDPLDPARACAEGDVCEDGLCRPIVCGDGLVEGGEQCDDGNRDDDDGCDGACAIEPLGVVLGSGDYFSAGLDAGGVDRYRLRLAGVARVGLEVVGADGGCPGDTLMRLLDAEGALLAEDDDGGVEVCSQLMQGLEPGAYTVEVSGWDGQPLPGYVLRVTIDLVDPG